VKTFFITIIILFNAGLSQAQNLNKIGVKLGVGSSFIKYKTVNNAVSIYTEINFKTSSKLYYALGFQYIVGSNIKEDFRDINNRSIFYYNTLLQQNTFNTNIGYSVLDKKVKINLTTGLGVNFLKASYVENIYLKTLNPNGQPILVSETAFIKKVQIGNITEANIGLGLKKISPGINLKYQIQKEFQFFTPSFYLKYNL
jgi:hypothetical protein